jgi:VIT1/CCC1 family predicted Fe2+/Mn2+ transporter
MVFGVNDGLVSTLAFVSGASAAFSDPRIILLAALTEVVAGAISMGFGAFVAARSRADLERRERAAEAKHLHERPEEEVAELVDFLCQSGMEKKEAAAIAARLAAHEPLFLSLMVGLELGIRPEPESPLRAGATMGGAFVVGALPALLSFAVVDRPLVALALAIVSSSLLLVAVGVWRSAVGLVHAGRTVAEMVGIGAAATATSYFLGSVASRMLP